MDCGRRQPICAHHLSQLLLSLRGEVRSPHQLNAFAVQLIYAGIVTPVLSQSVIPLWQEFIFALWPLAVIAKTNVFCPAGNMGNTATSYR